MRSAPGSPPAPPQPRWAARAASSAITIWCRNGSPAWASWSDRPELKRKRRPEGRRCCLRPTALVGGGQTGTILVDRRVDRRHHRLCGLIPLDRVGHASERDLEHLVHARDRDDLKPALDAGGDFGQVLGVLLRYQHGL